MEKVKIGIINVSDRASRGEYEDLPGQEVRRLLNLWLSNTWESVYAVIPDEQPLLEKEMKNMVDVESCCLIVTTGGIGPAQRDVTPEATVAVCEKLLPGFGEQMRQVSLNMFPQPFSPDKLPKSELVHSSSTFLANQSPFGNVLRLFSLLFLIVLI